MEVNTDKPISQMQAVGHHGGHIALYSDENSQLIVVYNTERMDKPIINQQKVKRLSLKNTE